MGDESPRVLPRRRALATTAAVAGTATVPGCTALRNQTGATDVILYNAASGTRTVSITITANETEEPHTSRTLAVPPNETIDPVNRSKLPTNTSYTVDISVENGPSETFEGTIPLSNRHRSVYSSTIPGLANSHSKLGDHLDREGS